MILDDYIFWGLVILASVVLASSITLIDFALRSFIMIFSAKSSLVDGETDPDFDTSRLLSHHPNRVLPTSTSLLANNPFILKNSKLSSAVEARNELKNEPRIEPRIEDEIVTNELDLEHISFEQAYDSLKKLPEHLRENYLKHYALHPHLVKALMRALKKNIDQKTTTQKTATPGLNR